MATMLSSLGDEKTLHFLMGAVANFDLLVQWFPKDRRSFAKYFVSPVVAFQNMTCGNYLEAAQLIIKFPTCLEKVPNMQIKTVLQDFVKLRGLAMQHEDAKWTGIAEDIFMELSAAKLGVAERLPVLQFECEEADADIAKAVMKVLGTNARKFMDKKTSTIGKISAFVRSLAPAPAPVEQTAPAQTEPNGLAASSVSPAAVSAPSEAPQSPQGLPAMPQAGSDKDLKWVAGAFVRTSFGNKKDHFDQKLGKIIKFHGLGSATVFLLEGPAKLSGLLHTACF